MIHDFVDHDLRAEGEAVRRARRGRAGEEIRPGAVGRTGAQRLLDHDGIEHAVAGGIEQIEPITGTRREAEGVVGDGKEASRCEGSSRRNNELPRDGGIEMDDQSVQRLRARATVHQLQPEAGIGRGGGLVERHRHHLGGRYGDGS